MRPERIFSVGSHPCQGYRKTSYNGWAWGLLSTGSLKFREWEPDEANGELYSTCDVFFKGASTPPAFVCTVMAFRYMPTATQGGGTMPAQTIKTWIARHISVRTRLEQVCVNYLLFLMVATPKHSFTQAARFSGLHKSAFCKLLKDHFKVAAYTLDD